MTDYRLRVGEAAAVRPRWWGKSWSILFAGILACDTCSVVVTWTMGHNSAAYNLYLDRNEHTFHLPVGTVEILERSPQELRLRFKASRTDL